jgi:hypothetical protein
VMGHRHASITPFTVSYGLLKNASAISREGHTGEWLDAMMIFSSGCVVRVGSASNYSPSTIRMTSAVFFAARIS